MTSMRSCVVLLLGIAKVSHSCSDVTEYTRTNRRDLFALFMTWSTPTSLSSPQETCKTLRMAQNRAKSVFYGA
jgi:hypothetical protein